MSTDTAEYDLVVRGRRIVTTAGTVAREVGIRDGRVVAIEPLGNGLAGREVIELTDDQVLIPGQVALRGMGIGRIPVVNIENACRRILAVGARYAAGFR